ncbi:hypothetical protein P3X46_015166 [Hevea brasiliensis]|uniref:Homeobox domain-containing protein n=1 Tax=Hevea brasiliensis TaxID=3981 RepID=A0ABQ9LV19_HEVBR|nr:homeobox protein LUMINIDEPENDENS [Hevea brasiliensis]KAJ9171859.1 hypothetical protein P3X46_015166 [Hevea brasiliensis]
MEALKENLEEIEIGSSVESFHRFLGSQKELFHSQIDQLQRIVVNQCKLTGVNPLSQEMAAGAMSIKIGKRPRDLLNPKAIKYMQAVFSIKDAISKKESREISAQFGVTVTQVRDFFASQRSRVRKLVHLSREKAARTNSCKEPQDGVSASSDPMIPIDLAPLNSVHPDPVPLNSVHPDPVPLNSVGPDLNPIYPAGPSNADEAPSCSTQGDVLPGLNDSDKHFVENIFIWLRKEETFSGQVKLMEWILQIQNPSVLNWFLTKGGVMILATWLSQAAVEEQTSILLVALKVLCHLPLHRALPEHMSAILHSVNKLRFYRTSDISNRARVLLSRWSKIFAREAMKKPNGVKSSIDAQEMILKQSIDEIMGNELWQPNVGNPEDVLALSESSENTRKIEPSQTLKLLTASTDDSSRKHALGVSHTRERRKVQLVEQPGQKTAGRSPQATKAVSVSQSRPMSTDDIQKAKMRALFMQGKHGKTGSSSNGANSMKTESSNKPSNTPFCSLIPASKIPPQPKIGEPEKPVIVPPKISDKQEGHLDPKHKMNSKEPLGELCRRVQIPWQTPSEIKLNSLWRVGIGENSKEVDGQKNRNRRELETIYRTAQDIPSNPREPWDREMDYDDTLTPDIPIEQPPDADGAETQVSHNENTVNNTVVAQAPSLPQIIGGGAAEPDLELLAVLLKNPELVIALTSGQAGNLSTEETVKLLDMIKRNGAGLASCLNGFSGKIEERVEVSLPSPTPSSNSGTSGWRPEDAKNPFSQQGSGGNRIAFTDPGVPTYISTVDKLTGLVQSQNQARNISMPQQQASLQLPLQHQQVYGAIPPFSWPQTTSTIPENRQPSMVLPSHQSLPTNSSILQTPVSEMGLATKNLPVISPNLHNFSATAGPSVRIETVNNVKPAPIVSFAMNTPDRQAVPFPMPIATPTPAHSHPLISEPALVHSSRPSTGNMGSMPDSWRGRQGLATSSPSQVNRTNYDASLRGPVQPHLQSGPPWERNEYAGDEGFESWSPENSPVRSPEYMHGRNYQGSRMNPRWNYTPDNRSRQRNYSGNRDNNRNGNGNRRWR